MVHDVLWLRATPHGRGKLCVGCIDIRLARRLEPRDFIDAPVNRRFDVRTEQLRSRTTGSYLPGFPEAVSPDKGFVPPQPSTARRLLEAFDVW
jgi:hypothetical protein